MPKTKKPHWKDVDLDEIKFFYHHVVHRFSKMSINCRLLGKYFPIQK